jgi:hypothetical protein
MARTARGEGFSEIVEGFDILANAKKNGLKSLINDAA